MTETKLSNTDVKQDAMADEELGTVVGGGLLFDAVLPQIVPILAPINPPTPAGPRPGVGTTHRTN